MTTETTLPDKTAKARASRLAKHVQAELARKDHRIHDSAEVVAHAQSLLDMWTRAYKSGDTSAFPIVRKELERFLDHGGVQKLKAAFSNMDSLRRSGLEVIRLQDEKAAAEVEAVRQRKEAEAAAKEARRQRLLEMRALEAEFAGEI